MTTLAAAARQQSIAQPTPIEALLLSMLAAQRELVAEIRGLRADLHKPSSNRSDSTRHDALVAPVLEAVEHRAFSARELRQHAERVDGTLRGLLDAAGLVNARKLGKWLRSIEGRDVAGVRLECLGVDNQGAIWIFRRV